MKSKKVALYLVGLPLFIYLVEFIYQVLYVLILKNIDSEIIKSINGAFDYLLTFLPFISFFLAIIGLIIAHRYKKEDFLWYKRIRLMGIIGIFFSFLLMIVFVIIFIMAINQGIIVT